MANGHGGRRPGAGRPRKSAEEHFVTGDAGRRGRVLEHPSAVAPAPAAPLPVLDESDAPNSLTLDERLVWLALAPYAMQAGTLTPASEMAFVLLCKNIVLERLYAGSVQDRGGANHRGLIQRVEGGLDAFQLRPQGRRMPQAETVKPASKLDKFMQRA